MLDAVLKVKVLVFDTLSGVQRCFLKILYLGWQDFNDKMSAAGKFFRRCREMFAESRSLSCSTSRAAVIPLHTQGMHQQVL